MAPPTTVPHQTGVWSKLSLLLWKNFLLQIRHKFQTLMDIIIPVSVFLLLAYLQQLSSPVVYPKATNYPSLEINTLDTLWYVKNFFTVHETDDDDTI